MHSFRENLKQATFVWLIFLFVFLDVVLLLDRLHMTVEDITTDGWPRTILLALGIVWLGMLIYVFPLIAMFQQTTKELFSAAFGLAFSHLPSTLLFFVITAVLVCGIYWFPALILIDTGLITYLITLRIHVIFRKLIERVEKEREGENNEK